MKFNFSTAALPSVCPPIRLSVICFCPYIHPIISYLSVVLKLWGKREWRLLIKIQEVRIIETKNLNTKCGALLCWMYFKQVNYSTRNLYVYSFVFPKVWFYNMQLLFNGNNSSLLMSFASRDQKFFFKWIKTCANKHVFYMNFLLEIFLDFSSPIIRFPSERPVGEVWLSHVNLRMLGWKGTD